MIYFGMGFPGSKGVIDWTKKRIEQPYETTQYAFPRNRKCYSDSESIQIGVKNEQLLPC